MENASKALIIAGAILLSILIIAIGIYVYNQANSTITSSMSSMNTQEREAFNNQFTSYQGIQTGSQVKALLTRVASNLNTYKDQAKKVPTVILYTKNDTDTAISSVTKNTLSGNHYKATSEATNYTKDVSSIRNKILDKHSYSVNFRFGQSGLVMGIAIGDVTNMTQTQIQTADGIMENGLNNLGDFGDETPTTGGGNTQG